MTGSAKGVPAHPHLQQEHCRLHKKHLPCCHLVMLKSLLCFVLPLSCEPGSNAFHGINFLPAGYD